MMTTETIKFVEGVAVIKTGRKIAAKIYDRDAYWTAFENRTGKTRCSYSEKYPFSLTMACGIKECVSLADAVETMNRYL